MRLPLTVALMVLALAACSLPPSDAAYAPYENLLSPTTQFGGGGGGAGSM
jgi:hypothetical protein